MKKVLTAVLKLLGVATIITACVFVWNLYDINRISESDYTIYTSKISSEFNGYKIAFISDFHNAEFYEKAAKKTSDLSPDLILIGGDMVNLDENSYDNTLKLFEKLVKIAPVYMVTGNHEIYHSRLENIKSDFEKCGVKLLNDESVKIYKNEDYIQIYGMKDPAVKDSEITDNQKTDTAVSKAADGALSGVFSVMLMHRANMFDVVYNLDYDLILSGHIHGGVVRLPFVGGVFSPERDRWFPKYTKGEYTLGKTQMIVSAGMDKQRSKPRFLNGPELVSVTLKLG